MKSVNYYAGARIVQLHNKVAVYGCHNSWPHLRLNSIKLLIPKSLANEELRCIDPSLIFLHKKKKSRHFRADYRVRKKNNMNWLLLLLMMLIHWFLLTNFHTFVYIDVNLIAVMKMLFFENRTHFAATHIHTFTVNCVQFFHLFAAWDWLSCTLNLELHKFLQWI